MNYRDDFPIFSKLPDLIYLDSAATTQKPQVVIDEITNFYTSHNANIHRGLYSLSEDASIKVEKVRGKVANFIKASSSQEIIFTKSTTEGINLLAYSLLSDQTKKIKKVVVSEIEHHANFVPWQQLAIHNNKKFDVIPLDQETTLKSYDFGDTDIFSISYVSNVTGTVLPVKEIITQAKKQNPQILIIIDAAQAASHLSIDVQDLGCDFLVFSGHKMFAETGVGVLYGKKEILSEMRPFLFGGDMVRSVTTTATTFEEIPTKFEGGTLPLSGIVSLGSAIDYINKIGMKNIEKIVKDLTSYCYDEIKRIPGIRVIGLQKNNVRDGIISFTMEGIHPHDIAQVLADENICIRAGHHCCMPLHKSLGILASARISLHIYNTKKDMEKCIEGIIKVQKLLL